MNTLVFRKKHEWQDQEEILLISNQIRRHTLVTDD